jgi:hypothetical protein
MCGVAAIALVLVSTGVVKIPGLHGGSARAETGAGDTSLAADRLAADRQWATATCTNLLAWKAEIERDGTSLNLSLGAVARVKDAIAATNRALNELDRLGLPPSAQNASAQAEVEQLRSDIESRLRNLDSAAGSVVSGNLGAIGTLLGDLESDGGVGSTITAELRQVVSVDLGLSLAETKACRQLVGIPV